MQAIHEPYIILYLYYIILYYIILHYIILHYTILHYIILYYIILYYIILYYIILYYIILYYIILYYIILHYIILYYIILYYIILYYIILYNFIFIFIIIIILYYIYFILYYVMLCYVMLYYIILYIYGDRSKGPCKEFKLRKPCMLWKPSRKFFFEFAKVTFFFRGSFTKVGYYNHYVKGCHPLRPGSGRRRALENFGLVLVQFPVWWCLWTITLFIGSSRASKGEAS